MKTIDEGFLLRVYRTSLIAFAFGLLVCYSTGGLSALVGWTLGCGLSIGVLKSLEYIVRRVFVPGFEGAKSALLKYSLMKLPFVVIIIAAVVYFGRNDIRLIVSFFAGGLLVQAVIGLKVLGMLAQDKLAR